MKWVNDQFKVKLEGHLFIGLVPMLLLVVPWCAGVLWLIGAI